MRYLILGTKETGTFRQKILKLITLLIFPLALTLIFCLRLIFSPYWTFFPDLKAWLDWGQRIVEVGFPQFYDNFYDGYMPIYHYVLWLLEHIHRAFPSIRSEVLFKLPANLSDLGITLLIFAVLKQNFSSRASKIVALSYFLNPAILSNSTFWGQVDAVHCLPIILCLAYGIQGKIVLSSIFAILAFLIKPNSMVIFPFVGLFLLKHVTRYKEDKIVPSIASIDYSKLLNTLGYMFIIAFFILLFTTLPFIWDDIKMNCFQEIFIRPFILTKRLFFISYDRNPFSSVNAFNFWGAVHGMWQSDQQKFLYIRYQYWGTILFVLFYGVILFKLLKDLILRGGNIQVRTSIHNFKIAYAMALVFLALSSLGHVFMKDICFQYLSSFLSLFYTPVYTGCSTVFYRASTFLTSGGLSTTGGWGRNRHSQSFALILLHLFYVQSFL